MAASKSSPASSFALYLTDGRHVWGVSPAGILSAIPGPWEGGGMVSPIITALAADAGGNLFIAEWIQHQI